MLNDLKRAVCKANKELLHHSLVKFDWGSVSAFDMSMGAFVIRPIGISYEDLQPELMVVMSMDGQKMEGRLDPAEDSPLHQALYNVWPLQVGAICRADSLYATAFAQAGEEIPVMGGIHARTFHYPIPVTRKLTQAEQESDSLEFTKGSAILEVIPDPQKMTAALVHGYGAVCWGANCQEAVERSVILETLGKLSYVTRAVMKNEKGKK
jgi:L-ribulose-5-phosphate 4-epimerase